MGLKKISPFKRKHSGAATKDTIRRRKKQKHKKNTYTTRKERHHSLDFIAQHTIMMDTRTMQVLYMSLQRCCFVLWLFGSHDLVIKAKEMSQFSSSSSSSSLRSRHYHPRRRRRRLELNVVATSDSTVVTTPDNVDDDDDDDTTSRGLEKTPIMSDPMDCSSFNETDFGGTLPCRRTSRWLGVVSSPHVLCLDDGFFRRPLIINRSVSCFDICVVVVVCSIFF